MNAHANAMRKGGAFAEPLLKLTKEHHAAPLVGGCGSKAGVQAVAGGGKRGDVCAQISHPSQM